MITGIVVALPEELSTLTAKKIDKGCVGQLNDSILVIYSGAGRENARFAAGLLVAQGANQLISWGCAAALDATLRPGDLVLANRCVDADDVVYDPNIDWINYVQTMLSRQLPVCTGKLVESRQIVSSSFDKAKIAQTTGAIVLDMESASVANVAHKHGLPFLSVRAIVDPANMDLPKAVGHALNDQGEIVIGKLLSFLLLHPGELPSLIKLGLHFQAAKKTLKLVAKELSFVTTLP